MSAKEIAQLLRVSTRAGGPWAHGATARVAEGRGGGECLFWRSCQGAWGDGMGEAREGGEGQGREAVGSG